MCVAPPVAVRYSSHMVSAKDTQGHMCCHAVSNRAAATTWELSIPRGKPTILCLCWGGLLCGYCSVHINEREVVRFSERFIPPFAIQQRWIHGAEKEKEEARLQVLYTLTIDLNLLLHCDSGKGHGEMEWVLGFRTRARRTMSNTVQARGNGLYLSAQPARWDASCSLPHLEHTQYKIWTNILFLRVWGHTDNISE